MLVGIDGINVIEKLKERMVEYKLKQNTTILKGKFATLKTVPILEKDIILIIPNPKIFSGYVKNTMSKYIMQIKNFVL